MTKRAISVQELMATSFNELPFTGVWADSFGKPEQSGSMIFYGLPKNGKTTLALQFAKYLTQFGRVAYNSIEEGRSLSFKNAVIREQMYEVGSRFKILNKEPVADLIVRLKKQKSPDFVFFDSVQFAELTFKQYKELKEGFPKKLFIFISHIEGSQPEGRVAKRIKRDADVFARIEGFTAYPTGRHGGGAPYIINEQLALEYGQTDSNK